MLIERKFIILVVILSLFWSARADAGLYFLKKTTLRTEDGKESHVQQMFYSEGEMVRIEEESSGTEGNPGIRIYDFNKKKLYTIMLDVKLYMEQDIGSKKEGIMFELEPEKRYVKHKSVQVIRTKQGEEIIQGHPATIYEVKVIHKNEAKKGKEERVLEQYKLWVAEDLEKMPIRYEFDLANNTRKIIEYLDIKTEAMESSLFSIPEGYITISPY